MAFKHGMHVNQSVVRDADDALEAIISMAKSVEDINQDDYAEALDDAVPFVVGEARRMLVANYNSSGVKTRSGDLLKAIKRSFLEVFIDDRGGAFFKASMPPELPDSFYIRANAVNYGRVNSSDFNRVSLRDVRNIENSGRTVRAVRKVGAKRRRKLKDKIQRGNLKGLVKPAKGLSFSATATSKTKAGSTVVKTSLGTATVTKAFLYYYLLGSQKARLRRALVRRARGILEEKLGNALKG